MTRGSRARSAFHSSLGEKPGTGWRPLSTRLPILFAVLVLGLLWPVAARSEIADQRVGFTVEEISIREGLSQSTVFTSLQDSHGVLWFGTEDGLNKFDGYRFRVYQHRSDDARTLSDNWISDLHEDRQENFWIVTRKGLDRLDRSTGMVLRIPLPVQEPPLEGWALLETARGELYLGTDGGLFRVGDEEAGLERVEWEGPVALDVEIRDLLDAPGGVLWLATWGEGLLRLDDGRAERLRCSGGPDSGLALSRHLRGVHLAEDGILWVTSQEGLFLVEPGTRICRRFRVKSGIHEGLSAAHLTTITNDSQGRIWVGTRSKGAFVIGADGSSVAELRAAPHPDATLSQATVWSIVEDDSGSFWLGLGTGGGINKLSARRFDNRSHNPFMTKSLSSNQVWAILEARDGMLWVGTSHGLNRYEAEIDGFVHFHSESDLPMRLSGDRIWALAEEEGGEIWVGTYSNGLNRVRRTGSGLISEPVPPGRLSNDRIRALYFDRHGDLWVGTDGGGLNRFSRETGSWQALRHDFNEAGSLSDDRVWSLVEDRRGYLWVGTDGGGLSRLDPERRRFDRFSPESTAGLNSDRVWALLEASDGRIWVGTKDGGLSIFDYECDCFEAMTEETSELPNNTVYGIVEDLDGDLWVSSNRGISRIDSQRRVTNFGLSDGLPSREFNFGAHHLSASGRVFFGGIRGVVSFRPEAQTTSDFEPKVVFTSVAKGNHEVLHEILSGSTLVLEANERFVSFRFASLDYRSPLALRYRYRLEGVDTGWRESPAYERIARYSFLPAGRYLLSVQATNRDGRWSSNVASLWLEVREPFWKSAWLRILLALAAISAAILWYRRRKAEAAAVSARLAEGREVERSELASRIHDGPEMSVWTICHRLEAASSDARDAGQSGLQTQLTEAELSLRKLGRELKRLCSEQAVPPRLAEYGLAVAIDDYLQHLDAAAPLPEVELLVTADESSLRGKERLALYRVFQKAIGNVIRHARASAVEVRTRCQGSTFLLEVRDDGVGFEMPDDWLSLAGEHFGLLSARDTMRAVGGTLEVRSAPGQGTRVICRLRVGRRRRFWFRRGRERKRETRGRG